MIIEAATVKLYAPWVHSLKEKRMIVKSIIAKVRNKFNVSIVEIAEQDTLQTIFIAMVCVTDTVAMADRITNKALGWIEQNTEAEVLDIQREFR